MVVPDGLLTSFMGCSQWGQGVIGWSCMARKIGVAEQSAVGLSVRLALGQAVDAFGESFQVYWKTYALLGSQENDESSRLTAAQFFEQIIVHHHFSHTPIG